MPAYFGRPLCWIKSSYFCVQAQFRLRSSRRPWKNSRFVIDVVYLICTRISLSPRKWRLRFGVYSGRPTRFMCFCRKYLCLPWLTMQTPRSLNVTFVCDKEAGRGIPQLNENKDDPRHGLTFPEICSASLIWRSAYAVCFSFSSVTNLEVYSLHN